MEFKSLFIDCPIIILKREEQKEHISPDFDVIEVKHFIDDFMCFRIERYQNASKFGVESKDNNEEHVPLQDELQKRDIFLQDFIVIDQQKRDIYYTGSKAVVEEVMKAYYGISKARINSRISLENLEFISEIKIVEYFKGQKNIFTQDDEFQVNQEISELFRDPNPVEKITRSYTMKRSHFNRIKFKDLIERYNYDKLRKYTIEGKDKDGNFMKYSDGVFVRKYDVFSDDVYKNYKFRRAISLEEIKENLKKVIK